MAHGLGVPNSETNASSKSLCDDLQGIEKNLLSSLKWWEGDVLQFHKELLEGALISTTVSNAFVALDHENLDVLVRIRFLIVHVIKKLIDQQQYLDNFSDVLCRHGLAEIWEMIKEGGHEIYHWENLHVVFNVKDLNILTEVLVEGSYKWKQIGMSLNLPRHEIEQCGKEETDVLKLANILDRWLSNQPHTTLTVLSHALSSELVGLKNLSNKLVKTFLHKVEKSQNVGKSVSSSQCGSPIIKHQTSGNIKITTDKSALLQVWVKSEMAVSYQWKKDGHDLVEDKIYNNVTSAILMISRVNSQTEGHYRCRIRAANQVEIESYDISLKVLYSKITRYFFEFYSQLDENSGVISWPPATAATSIEVTLIKKDMSGTKMSDYIIREDVDQVIESKEKIKYEELFSEMNSKAFILVEGRPGSGKTTLMNRITSDWAVKKNILFGAQIVILVPLSLFSRSSEGLKLLDIIKHYTANEKKKQEIVLNLEESDGQNICFLIDGLDEYQFTDDKDTFIYQLLHRQLFPQSMIIVTSRPDGSAPLRKEGKMRCTITKRVEILGFSTSDVLHYVKDYNFEDTSGSEKLSKYLNSHSRVLRMCYLPVNAAIICHLYDQKSDLPQSETEIYKMFTLLSVARKRMKEGEETDFESVSEMPIDMKIAYENICKQAYIMMVKSKQAIDKKEAIISLTEGSYSNFINLFTIDKRVALVNMKDFYTFLHLTLQEYLASVHISELKDRQQIECISLYKDKPEFLMVWRFFCGIVDFTKKKKIGRGHFQFISDGYL